MKIKRKEHLTEVGIKAIVNIRNLLNRGLSSELKKAFTMCNRVRDNVES